MSTRIAVSCAQLSTLLLTNNSNRPAEACLATNRKKLAIQKEREVWS